VTRILCPIISAFQIALLVRAILSWFPVRRGSAVGQVAMVAQKLTEPVLAPIRRALPMLQTSGLDLTFLLVVLAVQFVKARIGCVGGMF
jgi:YggT family protein